MKLRATALAILATILLSRPSAAWAEPLSLKDLDKQAHVAVSYGLTLSSTLVLRKAGLERWQAVSIAAATTMLLGTVKEVWIDDRYTWADQGANAIGTGLAVGFVFVLEL
jgi:hypothetical protein